MENLQITRVMRVGSSLAIVIPVNILRALKIERGDQMTFGVYADDVICIRKIQQEDLQKLKPKNIYND